MPKQSWIDNLQDKVNQRSRLTAHEKLFFLITYNTTIIADKTHLMSDLQKTFLMYIMAARLYQQSLSPTYQIPEYNNI
jgi:hypothetical protein